MDTQGARRQMVHMARGDERRRRRRRRRLPPGKTQDLGTELNQRSRMHHGQKLQEFGWQREQMT